MQEVKDQQFTSENVVIYLKGRELKNEQLFSDFS